MARLLQRSFIQCPSDVARASLERALLAELGEGGALRLRLPITVGSRKFAIEKDVVVSRESNASQAIRLRWKPLDDGPYPEFDGTLSVHVLDEDDACSLELEGTYDPPGGVAGAAFDALLGSRIAAATARELIHRVGRRLTEAARG